MVQESQTPVSFSASVSPNTSGRLSYDNQRDATIEHVQVRIYAGAELDLELKLLVVTRSGNRRQIVELVGKDVIDGDDDFYTFHPAEPVQSDEQIVIEHENVNANNTYDYRVNMDLDYEGGVHRALEDALGREIGVSGGML